MLVAPLIVTVFAMTPVEAFDPKHVVIQLETPLDLGYVAPLAALAGGFYERNKLGVTIKPGASGDAIDAVTSGNATVGLVNADDFLMACAAGVPLVAVATNHSEPSAVILSTKREPIRLPRDLVGKSLGYVPGTFEASVYAALMDKANISRGTVSERGLERQDMELLSAGSIDALVVRAGENMFDYKDKQGGLIVLKPADLGIHVPGDVYIVSRTTAVEQPEFVTTFLRATFEGLRQAYADYDVAADLLRKAGLPNLSTARVRFSLEQQAAQFKPFGLNPGEIPPERWRSLQNILLQQRAIRDTMDLSKCISQRFTTEVYRHTDFDRD